MALQQVIQESCCTLSRCQACGPGLQKYFLYKLDSNIRGSFYHQAWKC